MLQPKRTKFRKAFKGRIHGTATSGATLAFGQYGLKALEPERVTARQIEAARRALTRFMKRAGRVWIRVFPDVPVSKKPIEVRMGKGKGTPEFWVARVKPGRILFEVDGIPIGDRQGSAGARRRQAAGQDPFHRTHRRVECHESRRRKSDDARPARRRGAQAEEGAVQSALPAGHRSAREYLARARHPPRHRAHQDHRGQKRAGRCRDGAETESGDEAQGGQAEGRKKPTAETKPQSAKAARQARED